MTDAPRNTNPPDEAPTEARKSNDLLAFVIILGPVIASMILCGWYGCVMGR